MSEGREAYLDWKDWGSEAFGQYDRFDANYFAAETGLARDSDVRVLEVGFGNGPFIGWSRAQGIDVYGIELNPELVERCRALLGPDKAFLDLHDPRLSNLEGTFTHVVAFDVIEHVAQPELPHLLRRLGALLKEDGRIILRFPNGDSPFGRIYQHGDPTHVTTIGRHKILYLAQESGLRVVEIRAPRLPLRGLPLRNALKRALVTCGRYVVDRVIGVLYFGGQAIPLHPNYIAVMTRIADVHRAQGVRVSGGQADG